MIFVWRQYRSAACVVQNDTGTTHGCHARPLVSSRTDVEKCVVSFRSFGPLQTAFRQKSTLPLSGLLQYIHITDA